jgi:hypothetical protein
LVWNIWLYIYNIRWSHFDRMILHRLNHYNKRLSVLLKGYPYFYLLPFRPWEKKEKGFVGLWDDRHPSLCKYHETDDSIFYLIYIWDDDGFIDD